jgi:hypothetical protein
LKSLNFWIFNNLLLLFLFLCWRPFWNGGILEILKTKSTTLSDDLFLCQVSKGSAVRFPLNIFSTLVTYHGNGRHFEFVQPPPPKKKCCHTLRWIFVQSFMKFDERNPKKI